IVTALGGLRELPVRGLPRLERLPGLRGQVHRQFVREIVGESGTGRFGGGSPCRGRRHDSQTQQRRALGGGGNCLQDHVLGDRDGEIDGFTGRKCQLYGVRDRYHGRRWSGLYTSWFIY